MFGVKKTLTCKVGCSMLHQALATMWDVSAYGWSQHPPLRLRCRILNVGAVNGFNSKMTKKVTNVFGKRTNCIIFAIERFAPRD